MHKHSIALIPLIILLFATFTVGVGGSQLIQLNSNIDEPSVLPGTDNPIVNEHLVIVDEIKEKYVTANLLSGIYSDKIQIGLEVDCEDANIFFTLNGNDPDTSSIRYTKEIELVPKSNKNITIYTLKAVAYINNQCTPVNTQTYVLYKDAESIPDLDIVCISSDSNNLYDYYRGILVPGVTYDESVKRKDEILIGNYSNRSDDWIRDAHITMISAENGGLIWNQDIGLAVSGGTSAASDIKSLKIIAGDEYDRENTKLKYTYDNPDDNDSSAYSVKKYNSLVLRGSQDQKNGNIRSAVISRLANSGDFDGASATHRAAVYLNNQFYGVFDITQNYSDSYISRRYKLEDKDLIEKHKGDICEIFNGLKLSKLFLRNLNKKEYRDELEEKVDMESFLKYYAMNILVNNTDWPDNNFEIWKYTGEYKEDNEYTDGRFRFLMYDLDVTYMSDLMNDYFDGCKDDTFDNLIIGAARGYGGFFRSVMRSKYYRDRFVEIIKELFETSFSQENLKKVVEEEYAKIKKTNSIYYDEAYCENAQMHVDAILEQALEREQEIIELMNKYYFIDIE